MGTTIRSLEHAKILGPAAVEAWLEHMGGAGQPKPAPAVTPPAVSKAPDDGMNKLERAFWQRGNEAKDAHVFDEFMREPMRFNVFGDRWYKPDFFSIGRNEYTFWETKGFERAKDVQKLIAAADRYRWFFWVLVKREKQIWLCRRVNSRGISREVWTPDWLR